MSTRRPCGPCGGCAVGSVMVTIPTGKASVSDDQLSAAAAGSPAPSCPPKPRREAQRSAPGMRGRWVAVCVAAAAVAELVWLGVCLGAVVATIRALT